MEEDYTDEQLYQGVEIKPGLFLTKKRPYTPPRVLTGLFSGIEPPTIQEYTRQVKRVRQVYYVELDGEQDRRGLDLDD